MKKKEINLFKIVPNHLHNSYTRVGEQLFNRVYHLFKKENLHPKFTYHLREYSK